MHKKSLEAAEHLLKTGDSLCKVEVNELRSTKSKTLCIVQEDETEGASDQSPTASGRRSRKVPKKEVQAPTDCYYNMTLGDNFVGAPTAYLFNGNA